MDKRTLSTFITCLAIIFIATCSCSDKEDPIPSPAGGTDCTVSLDFSEYDPSQYEKAVYGIMVTKIAANGDSKVYSNYAYGLFDNFNSSLKLTLERGYQYRFHCYAVVDDVDCLYISNGFTGEYPFGSKPITNRFDLTDTPSGFQFDSNHISTNRSVETFDNTTYQAYPWIGIFIGFLDNFDPEHDGVVSLKMHKVPYCGVTIFTKHHLSHPLELTIPDGYVFGRKSNGSKEIYLRKDFTDSFGSTPKNVFITADVPNPADFPGSWAEEMYNFSRPMTLKFNVYSDVVGGFSTSEANIVFQPEEIPTIAASLVWDDGSRLILEISDPAETSNP